METQIIPPISKICDIKDWTLCFLGIIIVFGFFFIQYLVVTGDISPDNDTNVTTVLNYTNSLVIFVAGYFFGSSKSGGDKDKAIADMATASMGTGSTTTTVKKETNQPEDVPLVAVVNAEDTALKTEPVKPSLQKTSKRGRSQS